MSTDYENKCAMCRMFNLYDKYGHSSDKYKCTRLNQYLRWSEAKCGQYERSAGDRVTEIEKARAGKL